MATRNRETEIRFGVYRRGAGDWRCGLDAFKKAQEGGANNKYQDARCNEKSFNYGIKNGHVCSPG